MSGATRARPWTWRAQLQALLLAVVALAFAPALPAAERILSYDIVVDVRADGRLDVAETITVRAEGDAIRRGIYRDFPTRYRDRFGNGVVVGFDVVGVTRDGRREDWFTERRRNGVRLNTGVDAFLPAPGTFTYTLRYRTTRQLGFFADHDELYWNAIGHGWAFPISKASVRVRLPANPGTGALHAEAWTGAQGSRQRGATIALADDGATWTARHMLMPGHGMTVLLTFPKGIVQAPSREQRLRWFLEDNLGVLAAGAGLLLVLGLFLPAWLRAGRDPPAGTVVVEYDPPDDLSPAALRFLTRMAYDDRCFSADVLALSVGGELKIHRVETLGPDDWSLSRVGDFGVRDEPQRAILDTLLPGVGGRLSFNAEAAEKFHGARTQHARWLERRFVPDMFARNRGEVATMAVVGGLAVLMALAHAVFVGGGAGVPAILAIAVAILVVVLVAARLMKAPTPKGQRLRDRIAGFRRYLSVADREEIAALAEPGDGAAPRLDAARYEQLLPYAVALDVEDAWTARFTAAVGEAAAKRAATNVGWFAGGGPGGGFDSLPSLTSAVGSGLGGRIAAASSPPGSGGGGGGFSGGGGGGGGGGGR